MPTETTWCDVRPVETLFAVADRVALVTGASAGLGRRMAAVLHHAGARVVVTSRRPERLDEIVAALPGAFAIRCDATDDQALQDLVASAEAHFGPIEILVNNAATIIGATAQDERRQDIDETLSVNLTSAFRLAQMVYGPMAAAGSGSIINVTSILAFAGMGGRLPQASYAASKGGLSALTRELAAQWARDGIRVNAIAPGFFESEMTEEIFQDERIHDFIVRNSLIKRIGRPADFDGALLFLASQASAFVTGQTLLVDGGWTAR